MTVDGTIKYIEMILGRKLTGEEIFIVGIAFQNGILRGIEEERKAK